MTKAKLILAASTLILAVAGPLRAEDGVIERREVVESTQPAGSEPVVIEKRTTIERKDGSDVNLDVGDGGVVSSAVDLTGEALALPFKLVAGVLDLVF